MLALRTTVPQSPRGCDYEILPARDAVERGFLTIDHVSA
jgi:hypothetical protein